MNKKLIGGIVLLGGIGVIAYYFLFSKKSEQDLLKKFEEKKKNEDEVAKIDVDLRIGWNKYTEDEKKEQLLKTYKDIGFENLYVSTIPNSNIPFILDLRGV
jgi:hypothetical protein